jgi:hypothetical protein
VLGRSVPHLAKVEPVGELLQREESVPPPQLHLGQVHRDSAEPAAKAIWISQAPKVGVSANKRFLDDVLGLGRITEHRQDDGTRPVAVAVCESGECLMVAAESSSDELGIRGIGMH